MALGPGCRDGSDYPDRRWTRINLDMRTAAVKSNARHATSPMPPMATTDTTIALDAYFVYPEELKTVARVQVFRDFLVAKAQRWHF
jgi:hypothetical protein